ncbi:MAG: hypothetical protein RJA39_2001, partial [Pseudomonadota bacterium]
AWRSSRKLLSVLVKAETSGVEKGTSSRVIDIPRAPWARKRELGLPLAA